MYQQTNPGNSGQGQRRQINGGQTNGDRKVVVSFDKSPSKSSPKDQESFLDVNVDIVFCEYNCDNNKPCRGHKKSKASPGKINPPKRPACTYQNYCDSIPAKPAAKKPAPYTYKNYCDSVPVPSYPSKKEYSGKQRSRGPSDRTTAVRVDTTSRNRKGPSGKNEQIDVDVFYCASTCFDLSECQGHKSPRASPGAVLGPMYPRNPSARGHYSTSNPKCTPSQEIDIDIIFCDNTCFDKGECKGHKKSPPRATTSQKRPTYSRIPSPRGNDSTLVINVDSSRNPKGTPSQEIDIDIIFCDNTCFDKGECKGHKKSPPRATTSQKRPTYSRIPSPRGNDSTLVINVDSSRNPKGIPSQEIDIDIIFCDNTCFDKGECKGHKKSTPRATIAPTLGPMYPRNPSPRGNDSQLVVSVDSSCNPKGTQSQEIDIDIVFCDYTCFDKGECKGHKKYNSSSGGIPKSQGPLRPRNPSPHANGSTLVVSVDSSRSLINGSSSHEINVDIVFCEIKCFEKGECEGHTRSGSSSRRTTPVKESALKYQVRKDSQNEKAINRSSRSTERKAGVSFDRSSSRGPSRKQGYTTPRGTSLSRGTSPRRGSSPERLPYQNYRDALPVSAYDERNRSPANNDGKVTVTWDKSFRLRRSPVARVSSDSDIDSENTFYCERTYVDSTQCTSRRTPTAPTYTYQNYSDSLPVPSYQSRNESSSNHRIVISFNEEEGSSRTPPRTSPPASDAYCHGYGPHKEKCII